MLYTDQFTQIQNTLDKCTTIARTYNHSTSVDNEYPAVIYFPDSFENSFTTIKNNAKIYRWKMYVIVSAAQITMEKAQSDVLAGVVDDIIQQFDKDWNAGTVNGHRATVLIDSGTWDSNETEKSKIAFAELNLRIKVNTSIN